MIEQERPKIERDLIIDRIYQISLEPSSLDSFIDLWHDTDLAEHFVVSDDETSEHPNASLKAHLERAETILQRSEIAQPDLTEILQPYDNLAAFVVGGSFLVEAANSGAQAAFGVTAGDSLDQVRLPPEMRTALTATIHDVVHGRELSEKLLKANMATKAGAMLFRIVRLEGIVDNGPAALIVSTNFYWQETTGILLSNVFQLTEAEQSVVRMLVEGQDIKSIALNRDTGEGTVRLQIKSIIGKMNLRSQTDIVRLVRTLAEFPKGTSDEDEAVELTTPGLSNDWLETEVWKPFKAILLPDGRKMTYHDMGPPTGNPVLFSHMGSCMVRWSGSMIRSAYEQNLRVICPIRAGYGHSDGLDHGVDPLDAASDDTVFLLKSLNIPKLPYIAQGTDFPFAAHLIANHPDVVSDLIGVGARPCLPGGLTVDGAGRWQRFFVSTARHSPHLVQFASKAVMAMSKRIGPDAMLRQLCKDSPADLSLLEIDEIRQVLVANIGLMAGKSTNAARAFSAEYVAFQKDRSDDVMATQKIPVSLFLAQEDPTMDLGAITKLQNAYPWVEFEVLPNAGLALIYQKSEKLIPFMAAAARRVILSEDLQIHRENGS